MTRIKRILRGNPRYHPLQGDGEPAWFAHPVSPNEQISLWIFATIWRNIPRFAPPEHLSGTDQDARMALSTTGYLT
jgi:hypothetical protein